MGNALAELGRAPEALQAYARAIALDPHYADAHNGLGTVLAAQKKHREAISAFNKALRADPTNVSALVNLGYKENSARKALESMEIAPDASLETSLKAALKLLGK